MSQPTAMRMIGPPGLRLDGERDDSAIDMRVVAGRWPITVRRVRLEPARFERPPRDTHDLFVPTRTLELENLGPEGPKRFAYRMGYVGFTPAGLTWAVRWRQVFEGLVFDFPADCFAAVSGDRHDAKAATLRLALGEHAPAIAYLAMEIADLAFSQHVCDSRFCGQLQDTLLLLCSRRFSISWLDPSASGLPRRRPVAVATRFVRERLDLPLNVEEIAAAAGVSRSRLNLAFEQELGLSIWQFVIDQRLRQACRLLKNSELSLGEVAIRSGFSSASHLASVFRRRMGTSALQYRQARPAGQTEMGRTRHRNDGNLAATRSKRRR